MLVEPISQLSDSGVTGRSAYGTYDCLSTKSFTDKPEQVLCALLSRSASVSTLAHNTDRVIGSGINRSLALTAVGTALVHTVVTSTAVTAQNTHMNKHTYYRGLRSITLCLCVLGSTKGLAVHASLGHGRERAHEATSGEASWQTKLFVVH